MTQFNTQTEQFAELVSSATGLSVCVVLAWMFSENSHDRETFPANNNPFNIRFVGDGAPNLSPYPWFKKAVTIDGNQVVGYSTLLDGALATVALITNYYHDILASAGANEITQAAAIERSSWDAGHYNRTTTNEGTVVAVVRELLVSDPAQDGKEQETVKELQAEIVAHPEVIPPMEEEHPPTPEHPAGVPEQPPTPEHLAVDGQDVIGVAALAVSMGYSSLWYAVHDQASKDFVHASLMLLRAFLGSTGVGTVTAEGHLLVRGNVKEYTV